MSTTSRARVALIWLLWAACGCTSSRAPDAGALAPLDPAWVMGTPEPETARPRSGGTLVVRAMSEPAGLNFLDDQHRDGWTWRMTRNLVWETLLEIDPVTFELKPHLAEAFAQNPDGTRFTFRLRPDATFEGGAPLTPEDVVATFDAVMNPRNRTAGLRADFEGLTRWTKVGEREVELTWRLPTAFGLRHVAKLPIYPAVALAGDFASLALARKPPGTGPYRVSEWEPGQRLVLERRRDSATPARLDRIVFRFAKDHTVATALFEQGEFDLMTNLQPVVWRGLEAREPKNAWAQTGYRRLTGFENNFSYIAWNQALPIFQDPRVRAALAHAYPSLEVFKNVDLGLELPTSCPFYVGGHACRRDLRPPKYDPREAASLLTAAGFADRNGDGVVERDGVPFKFTFLMPPSSVRLGKLAPLLKEELRKLGVQMDIEKVEPAVLSQRVRARDYGAVSRVLTEFDTEQDLYFLLHSSQVDGGANVFGYQSQLADRLLEAIRLTRDTRKRAELEHQLQEVLLGDQPLLLMTTRLTLDMAKRRVHGLVPGPLWYDLRRAWVDAEAARVPDAGPPAR